MIYVILSVCCNILVAVLIKIARGNSINVQQLVLWNYPTTVLLTYFLLKPPLHEVSFLSLPFHFYIPLIILLPTLFIFIALAIRYSGIVKTDVAQRLSLFIPLLASFLLFGESIQNNKLFGIAVGLIAVVCSISKGETSGSERDKSVLYPLIVFFGMGVIDVLFKQIAQYQAVTYTVSMFLIFVGAMFFALGIMGWMLLVRKEKLDRNAIILGNILGVFNFFNIFLYMKAHRAIPDNPSIVFTTMNIGVIVLGTIVALVFFKEKISKVNYVGLFLAVVSILLIIYL